jgi:hypothetical protein
MNYEIIKKKDIIKKNFKKILKIINEYEINLNPKLNIFSIIINEKKINIIDESILLTGTKMRVAIDFIKCIIQKDNKINTFVYSGNYNGFGAVSVAFACFKLGLKAKVFIAANNDRQKILSSKQINIIIACKAKIYLCNTYREARDLLWKKSTFKNKDIKPNYFVVPMGLNDDDNIMINLLSSKIKNASINTQIDNQENLRIWMVSGSGGICHSIYKAFPNSKLFILPYGGNKYKQKLLKWSKINKNITILDEEKLNNSLINIYYSSVLDYDSLIFPYVIKYGYDNDYIWNVASDKML